MYYVRKLGANKTQIILALKALLLAGFNRLKLPFMEEEFSMKLLKAWYQKKSLFSLTPHQRLAYSVLAPLITRQDHCAPSELNVLIFI